MLFGSSTTRPRAPSLQPMPPDMSPAGTAQLAELRDVGYTVIPAVIP